MVVQLGVPAFSRIAADRDRMLAAYTRALRWSVVAAAAAAGLMRALGEPAVVVLSGTMAERRHRHGRHIPGWSRLRLDVHQRRGDQGGQPHQASQLARGEGLIIGAGSAWGSRPLG